MIEHFQFAAVMLMAFMAVSLAVWMPRWVSEDRIINRSRWLMAGGLALLGLQFLLQFIYGFRSRSVTQGVFVNLIFFIPVSALLSLSMLNLQRQGCLNWKDWVAGPLTLLVAAGVMMSVGRVDGLPLLSDTTEMRNAEVVASICFGIMLIYFILQHRNELRRMRKTLANYYDRKLNNLLDWMQYSVVILTLMSLLVPMFIYLSGLILTVYGLLIFCGIYYMWFQFVGYIRTNAALKMREAELNEEEIRLEKATSDDSSDSEYSIGDGDEVKQVEAVVNQWLEQGGHLHSGITIKTAAAEMHIPRYQLTAWLKTTEFEQFSPWITYHRIEAAKHLLKEQPGWNNETVAQQCGFTSRSYFQKVFKQQTGVTPTEYHYADVIYI